MQGVVVRPFLALFFTCLFLSLVFMVEQPSLEKKDVLLLEDFIYNSLLHPVHLKVKWCTDDYVTWMKDGKIIGYNVSGSEERVLLDSKDLSKRMKRKIKITDYSISYDIQFILLAMDAEMVWDGLFYANYLVYNITENTFGWLEDLTLSGSASKGSFSADGKIDRRYFPGTANAQWSRSSLQIAFTMDSDLYICNISASPSLSSSSSSYSSPSPSWGLSHKRITTDGYYPNILNGRMSWIYQHEIWETHNAIWWSPKGSRLAYFRTDMTSVKSVPIHTYHDDYTGFLRIKYPLVHRPNPHVQLVVYSLFLDSYETLIDEDKYITEVIWISEDQLLYRSMNRNQNQEYITVYDFKSGKYSLLVQEEPEAWVVVKDVRYLGNSQLAVIKNCSGYFHIEVIDISPGSEGGVMRVTEGRFDVFGIVGFDKSRRILYFTSNEADLIQQHIYGVFIPDYGLMQNKSRNILKKYNLFTQQGYYTGSFNELGTMIALNYEGPNIPHQRIIKLEFKNEMEVIVIREIEGNGKFRREVERYQMPRTIPMDFPYSGTVTHLKGELLVPAELQVEKRYPLLVYVDGTPGHQSVTSKRSFGFYEFLAAHLDIVVLRLDPTGTGGRGTEFLFKIHNQLGQHACEDYTAAVEHLLSDPKAPVKIDSVKIGVAGSNMGGHIALHLLMNNPDLFKAGVVLDPITSWDLYNSVFTEKYMSTPFDNKEGYNHTNILNYIPSLDEVNFLLIHGTEYNEVYSQNSAKLQKSLAYHGLKCPTISCADWVEDDKAHFYKIIITYLAAALNQPPTSSYVK